MLIKSFDNYAMYSYIWNYRPPLFDPCFIFPQSHISALPSESRVKLANSGTQVAIARYMIKLLFDLCESGDET